jgi:hypothetical protein
MWPPVIMPLELISRSHGFSYQNVLNRREVLLFIKII